MVGRWGLEMRRIKRWGWGARLHLPSSGISVHSKLVSSSIVPRVLTRAFYICQFGFRIRTTDGRACAPHNNYRQSPVSIKRWSRCYFWRNSVRQLKPQTNWATVWTMSHYIQHLSTEGECKQLPRFCLLMLIVNFNNTTSHSAFNSARPIEALNNSCE